MGEYKMKTRNIKKPVTAVLFIIIIITAVLGISYFSYSNFLKKPASDLNTEVGYKVEKGSTSSSIIESLYNNGLISNKLFAKIYVKFNVKKSLKAGEYKLNKSMNPKSIFEELQKGARDVDVIKVTFP
ncbi:MAG: mltG, partial [Clostridiales bacterium]|nr:mltG [Clostridiales bacterium]